MQNDVVSTAPTEYNDLSAALADRYRVERELGAGGMATVYLARDLKHDRDVAVKALHPDLAASLGRALTAIVIEMGC
jgi:serine/threonine-protein kinase